MTSETLAKSLESERKSGRSTAISIILVVLIIFGVYWFAFRASTQEAEKQTDPDEDGYHPTEEDYEYMDDDDFDDEDDLDDEDYDLLEEEDVDDATDYEAEEDDDVRISDILNETRM